MGKECYDINPFTMYSEPGEFILPPSVLFILNGAFVSAPYRFIFFVIA